MTEEHGPNCGLYVPTKEELEGIERFSEHPNFARHEPETLVTMIGATLDLPKGTPRTYPPYGGATKNWSERSRLQVRRIQNKAPGVVCATYFKHGRTGEAWGIDTMISPFNQKANSAQEEFGDHLCEWMVRNWGWLNLNYIIYWNWMNDGAGWFDYEPYRKQWSGGSQNLITSRHLDHIHCQVDNPNIAGNE